MSARSKYGVMPTCSVCRGVGWRKGLRAGEWPRPCPACKGEPCEPKPKALAKLLPCSLSTAYRILRGQPVSVKTIGALVDLAERLEVAS